MSAVLASCFPQNGLRQNFPAPSVPSAGAQAEEAAHL